MKLLTFVVFIILYHSAAPGQAKPYKEYDNIRFEGQQEVLYSAPDIELISFVGYRENFQGNRSYNLKIGFYFPYSEKDSLHIVARELGRPNKFYFMRPNQKNWKGGQWQIFARWPTKDVLDPLKIRVNQLGLVGRLNLVREGSGKIVPLHLHYSNLPDSITAYRLHFRPKKDLESLTFELIDLQSNQTIAEGKLLKLGGQETYTLMLDLSQKPAGFYLIILNGELRYELNRGPYREYTFFHNPQVE